MNPCSQCGTPLPDDAKFCLQCGTPVSTPEQEPETATPSTPEAPEPPPSRPSPQWATSRQQDPSAKPPDLAVLKPALAAGLALGLLSGIPVLDCLCCLWILGGGGFSVWMLNKQRPGKLLYGDGALVGVVSGLIGAVVATIVRIPVYLVTMTPERIAESREWIGSLFPNLPPETFESFDQFFGSGLSPGFILLNFVFNSISFGLFAMIGGILTVAMLNQQKKPE